MANRIQHKRSSLEGRRPSGSYLEPGEIALNTNAKDPGLFFEGNDGSIVKAGPAHVGKVEPYTEVGYGNGETWFNSASNSVNVWSAEANKWIKNISAPHGGAAHVVFVGSSYPEATDDVANDGESRPFATLNRAAIEIARRSILSARDDSPSENKFVICLLPGINTVYTEPGVYSDTFKSEVAPFAATDTLTANVLRKFNSETGGMILPRGTSIVGLDLKKCFIQPTSYPHWNRAEYEFSPNTVEDRSSIISITGNSFLTNITFLDKQSSISVKEIAGERDEVAVLRSLEPHGFRSLIINDGSVTDEGWMLSGDMVTLSYPDDVFLNNEGVDSIAAGTYVVEPISADTFYLRRPEEGQFILRRQLPNAPSANTSPTLWFDLSVELKTHHRLTAAQYTTEADLRQYYTKVQHAFSELNFGGVSELFEVLESEIVIGTQLPQFAVPAVNKVSNGGAALSECRVLSEYGMGGLVVDGEVVGGRKSAEVFDCQFTQFQNDPDVYDVYYDNQWIPLKEATWRGTAITEEQVTDTLALAYLTSSVKSENLRFHYTHAGDAPVPGSDTSSGLPDDRSDTRHSAISAINGSYINCDSVEVLGAAVAFWSRGGGSIQIRDSQVQYGIQSLRAEGFSGINTLAGAEEVHSGFEVQGVRLPSVITKGALSDPDNHIKMYLNTNLAYVAERSLTFQSVIDPQVIQPYTLKPGDVIWVDAPDGSSSSKATIADPPLSQDMRTINVLSENNGIFSDARDPATMINPPYIRRFVDPRPESHREYSLWVKNTDTKHQAPQPGSILRLSEDTGASIEPLLDPGYQLDPGANGGWNHVFKVHQCLTKEFGDNPNKSETLNQTTTTTSGYYLSLNPCDSFGPWEPTKQYASGAYSTLNYKVYKTDGGQINPSTVQPSQVDTTWGRSSFFEHLVPVGASYKNSDDLYIPGYSANATYLRGIGYDSGSMKSSNPIDYDDGSADLGLTGADGVTADAEKTSPNWQPSYIALRRFLELLGYEEDDLNNLLNPARWSDRNVPVESLGTLDPSCGYAASTGNWPVEFNLPSSIWCESMLWDYPGHLNYSKGLQPYRKSQLSQQLQRECEISEVWGGRVVATGLTADGDLINYRVTNV